MSKSLHPHESVSCNTGTVIFRSWMSNYIPYKIMAITHALISVFQYIHSLPRGVWLNWQLECPCLAVLYNPAAYLHGINASQEIWRDALSNTCTAQRLGYYKPHSPANAPQNPQVFHHSTTIYLIIQHQLFWQISPNPMMIYIPNISDIQAM